MDNCTSVTVNLLKKLHIPFTKQFLENTLLSHPDHPSLLCITDTLKKYGIENLAVKVDAAKLNQLPLPCIVQLSHGGGMFHALTGFSDKSATYLDDKNNPVTISRDQFLEKWTGICLLVETTETSAEPEIKKKLLEARGMNFLKWAVTILFSI